MNGALLELAEGQGAQDARLFNDQNQLMNKKAAQEYVEIRFDTDTAFNRTLISRIPRHADTVNSIHLKFNMAPLPQGWRYKRCWANHLIKNCRIEVGGFIVWQTKKEWLQMYNLIFENKNKELTFDYDAETRIELSKFKHEVIIEPINIKDLIVSEYGIPLIKLQYQEVKFIVELGSLIDCIESYNDNPEPLNEYRNIYLLNLNVLILYTFLDLNERRELALRNIEKITKHNDTSSIITTKENTNFKIDQSLICPAAYIHITDAQGNELPRQILKNLIVKISGLTRHDLSGFQSRHLVRNNLPHATKANNESQNLYYISYWPGRTNQEGAEQGINFSRIDTYSIEFEYENWVPNDLQFKISINHRTQNILHFIGGMTGFLDINMGTSIVPYNQELEFPDTDQLIEVKADDICMISHIRFEEGESVDQCNQCKKVCTTAMLKLWLATRNPHQHKCIHCSKEYNTNTFKRGKAHIVENE